MMPSARVDLRSDTFTVPDAGMRRAMAEAEVGDDVWGEDPTVRRLEEDVAERLGKAAGLYVSSGTQGNLVSIAAQTHPGDEVITDVEAHIAMYEVGGAAVVAGVQLHLLDAPDDGLPSPASLAAAIRENDIHFAISRLFSVENTHNRRGGGAVNPQRVAATARIARHRGLRVHCDGARLFNAAVALGCDAAELVRECDTTSVCLSKGLGAPVGSVVVGDHDFVAEARRWRKRLGGGMRQAGIIAAAGLYALENNLGRIAEDHANARRLMRRLAGEGADIVEPDVPTNMVLIRTTVPAPQVAAQAAELGILVSVMGPQLIRCMTYLNVDTADVDRAGDVLCSLLSVADQVAPA